MLQRNAHRLMVTGLVKVSPPAALPLDWMPAPSTMMAKAAPKPAPWEMPRVEAEAKGLRSTDWSTQPAAPSPAPPSRAVQIRGRRSERTTVFTAGSSAAPKMPRSSSESGVA